MYNLLIINNDLATINTIEQTLDWKKYDVGIIYEANDGLTAHRIIEQFKPHIILFDLRFHEMTLYELIRKLKDLNILSSILIVCERKDMDYARTILSHFIYYAFFVKPMASEGLGKALEKAIKYYNLDCRCSILSANQEDLSAIKDKILNELLYSSSNHIEHILEMIRVFRLCLRGKGRIIYGEMDDVSIYPQPLSLKANIDFLYHEVRTRLKASGIPFTFSHKYQHSFVLLDVDSEKPEVLDTICKDALIAYSEVFTEQVSIGISLPYAQIKEVRKTYKDLLKIIKPKPNAGLNTVMRQDQHKKPYNEIVIQVLDYITKNFHLPLKVNDLCKDLFVSDSHLLTQFKAETGKTLFEYLTDYRIIKAKKLLLCGEYKLQEIIQMVGYQDVKYFSRVFNKKVGVPPTTYIKLIYPKIELRQ